MTTCDYLDANAASCRHIACQLFSICEALSPMVVRVLRSLQVSPSDLKRYESQATARKEAWLVGVADPTDGQIPEGHVFVSHGSEKRRFEVLVRVVQCYSAWTLMKL